MCAIKKIWTTCRSAPKPFGNVVTTLWFHISSSSLTSRGFLTVRRKPWFGGGERSGIWHEICHLALMRVDPLHLTSSTSRLFMSHLLLVLYFENISIIFYNGLYDIGINLNAYMILLGLYIYIYISYFQYLLFFTCTCFSTSFPKQNNRFFHNSSKDCWCDASSSLKRLLVVKRVPNCRRWKAWSHGENSFVKTQPPKKR